MKIEIPFIFKISLIMSLSLKLTEILHFWLQNQWISTKQQKHCCALIPVILLQKQATHYNTTCL